MKTTTTFAFSAATLTLAICFASTAQVTFDWATVGNPGNAGDVQSQGTFGAVADTYRISKTEVTNTQYTEFLNAVDANGANTLSLFNTNMANNFGGIELQAANAAGSKFVAQAGRENNPVTYVSWYDSIRFINWLDNGQPTGGTGTESGAYTLLGGTATPSNGLSVTRDAGATVWLPSEDEWYKAAYYDPSGTYFDYALGSDTVPVSDQPVGDPSAVNYFNNDGVANGFNDGYAVSGSIRFGTNPFTDVGVYTAATSPYGTFDQNGNVWEWNEALIGTSFRSIRGGSWFLNSGNLAASDRFGGSPTIEGGVVGFRVASIPEPSSLLLGVLASIFDAEKAVELRFGRRPSITVAYRASAASP